jgi:hypothetical protein
LIIADSDELMVELKELISHAGWEIVREKVTFDSSRAGTSKIDLRIVLKPIMLEEVE